MLTQTRGKIFLSQDRGCTENNWFRSYHTFNFGRYRQRHKMPEGVLSVLNDETLAAGHTIQYPVETASLVALLPMVGVMKYTDSKGHEAVLYPGELSYFNLPEGASFSITNPYQEELINYLQLRFTIAEGLHFDGLLALFNLEENKNRLITVDTFTQRSFFLSTTIGKFEGRSEASYPLTDPAHGIFVFVLQGAFEVQNRLLEARDGLVLWDVQEIEMEALSNEAILLILEFNDTNQLAAAPFL